MTSPFVPQMALYERWLADNRGLAFPDYSALREWSVTELEAFWRSIWDYNSLQSPTPFDKALDHEQMPGAVWFEGARVNYVDQVFRHVEAADAAGQPAIIAEDERGKSVQLSWSDLRRQVASMAATLRDLGVGEGDRVAAYLPNRPEAVVAFLSCAAIGAIWSVCAPDMGTPAVCDRFRQIEPKVLIAVDGVFYAGRAMDRSATVEAIREALPSVGATLVVETPFAASPVTGAQSFAEAVDREVDHHAFQPVAVPFAHPLWILYSSGTTGLPKALVHSHGGVLVTALANGLHTDLGASYDPNSLGERFHWYSTTGWVMWNAQLSGLLSGTTICLFDGSPSGSRDAPDWTTLWRFAARHGVTFFGAGAAFYGSGMNHGVDISSLPLSKIRALGSTGSPLSPEVQDWGTEQFTSAGRPDIWWFNTSGGTDLFGAFTTGNRRLPQLPGRMQCRQLGAAVEAWNEHGEPVVGQLGELVCTRPIPAMPVFLWGDNDGARYQASYFEQYPGIWRHGDWIEISSDESCAIRGRSDSTINRGGLRMGTSEIYSAVEGLSAVQDALVVDVDLGGGGTELVLFVVLADDTSTQTIADQVAQAIKTQLSPRFVPDLIYVAPAIPRTLSGKKQEVPIKRILQGEAIERALDRSAMSNPECLDWYAAIGERDRDHRKQARTAVGENL